MTDTMAPEGTTPPAVDPERLALAQGCFNIANGLWPILSMGTFEAVFGPKVDRWLVYTVAGLLVTNGCSQIHASRNAPDVARTIGTGTAATMLTIDAIYVPRDRIRWTYLLDAIAEAGWLLVWRRAATGSGSVATRA